MTIQSAHKKATGLSIEEGVKKAGEGQTHSGGEWEEELKLWKPWFYNRLSTPDKDELVRLLLKIISKAEARTKAKLKERLEKEYQRAKNPEFKAGIAHAINTLET